MATDPGQTTALTRAGRGAAAAAILLLAVGNLAALLAVLHFSRIHPVHHYLVWHPPPDAPPVIFTAPAAVLAVLLAAGAWVLCRSWARARRATAGAGSGGPDDAPAFRPTFTRWAWAWAPAAAATIWVLAWMDDRLAIRQAALVYLYGCVMLLGWSAVRLARVCVSSPEPLAEPGSPRRWWREGPFWAVTGAAALAAIFHSWLQIRMHAQVMYGSPDIGYYAEMLLNVLRGRGLYCEAFGHHFFGEHFSPGLYLLVPIYALYPHIETLMVVGAAAVCCGALAVYAIVRILSGTRVTAAALAIAYLLFPANARVIYAGTYGFHEILLAIPLMLWSFYHYLRGRRLWMFLFILLALSIKEDVAVVYFCFGIYAWARDRSQWWGLLLSAACVLHFTAVLTWIVPAYNTSGTYSKFYLFKTLGGSPDGMISTLREQPWLVVQRLLSWQSLCFVLALTVPVAGVVFRSTAAAVALPTLVFICLMDNRDFASIRYWHQASILPVLWWAACMAVTRQRPPATAPCSPATSPRSPATTPCSPATTPRSPAGASRSPSRPTLDMGPWPEGSSTGSAPIGPAPGDPAAGLKGSASPAPCSTSPALSQSPASRMATVNASPFRVARPGTRAAWSAAVLVCCALTHYTLGISPLSNLWRDLPRNRQAQEALAQRLTTLIPPTATVQATVRLAAHFVNHERVHPIHARPANPPQWVVIDMRDEFPGRAYSEQATAFAQQLDSDPSYELVLQEGTVAVFHRREPTGSD